MKVEKTTEDARHGREFLMRPRQAADYLGVSPATLRKMENEEKLLPFRTPRGHRRYSLEMLEEYVRRNRRSAAPSRAEGSN